jgi:hypothetical protein
VVPEGKRISGYQVNFKQQSTIYVAIRVKQLKWQTNYHVIHFISTCLVTAEEYKDSNSL